MSVIFDQLRISDDGQRLYINLHVNKASYFENIYLDRMVIMTADSVSETSPHIPTEDVIYELEFGEQDKEANLVLIPNDFNESFAKATLSCDLFFVYVKIKGVPHPCTPCRLDEEITLGVTFDESLYYQKVIQFTKELVDNCDVPDNFIDLILLWNGFKAAVETEHYIEAIDYYNKMFRRNTVRFSTLGCGCHG